MVSELIKVLENFAICATLSHTSIDGICPEKVIFLSIQENFGRIILKLELDKVDILAEVLFHAQWFAHKQPFACSTVHLSSLLVLDDTLSAECCVAVLLSALLWVCQELFAYLAYKP